MKFWKAFGQKKIKRVMTREEKLKFYGSEFVKLVILALFLSPANSFLVNFMLFHPEVSTVADPAQIKEIKAKYNLTWTDVYFRDEDGTRLHAWYITQPGAKKTFLVSHGNGGNLAYRLPIVDALAATGSAMLLYGYSGYGKSEGQPTPDGIVKNGVGAYDFLVKQKKIAAADIIVYGESLGCSVSTVIAERRPVGGIVLQSPFSTIMEAGRDHLPWFRLFPDEAFPQRFLDNVTAYRKPHAPLLILHGKKDWILPSHYSETIYNSAIEPKNLVLLENSSHNDIYSQDKTAAIKSINSFVKNLISQTVANKKGLADQVKTVAITGSQLLQTNSQ